MAIYESAVVVGGTGLMGQVIVRQLADAGLAVIVVARNADKATRALGVLPSVKVCGCDIADDRATRTISDAVGGAPVRMVVHGPGVATAGGVTQVSTAAITEAVNIKVGGMLRLVRGVDKQLRTGARLVAIGGHYGFEPSAYAATAGVCNAALANLVRQLSIAYGERGVTAHLVAPGPVESDRLSRVAEARAERDGTSAHKVLEAMRQESVIGAFTTPEQVAWAVRMLLDPQANALAGSALFLDSGRRKGLP